MKVLLNLTKNRFNFLQIGTFLFFVGLFITSYPSLVNSVILTDSSTFPGVNKIKSDPTRKLPPEVQKAIENTAKREIAEANRPYEVYQDHLLKNNTNQQPISIGRIISPILQPTSPIYGLKKIGWRIQELVAFSKINKANIQLSHDKQRIKDAVTLLETGKSKNSIQKAIILIDEAGNDFEKLTADENGLKQSNSFQAEKVDALLNQAAFMYVKEQLAIQKAQDRLFNEDFLAVEKARQRHLQQYARIVVTVNKNPTSLGKQFEKLLASGGGSDFQRLKAIELLREMEESLPKQYHNELGKAEESIGKNLERAF